MLTAGSCMYKVAIEGEVRRFMKITMFQFVNKSIDEVVQAYKDKYNVTLCVNDNNKIDGLLFKSESHYMFFMLKYTGRM